ncbi:MAG: HlyD family secretion protein [Alphaproteobacteria bacterium]|nr:MAG: HlyD family secretion protein [Alphaproteobacteria bacterium]
MTASSIAADAAGQSIPGDKSRALRRTALVLGLLAGAAVIASFGHQYWTVGRFLESTDDAYVKADSTMVAPKVSGYVADVLVSDNEPVKAGQLLARIDDRDFQAALDEANAGVLGAKAAIDNLAAQITLQQSIIDAAKADLAASEASLAYAEADNERYHNLLKSGSGTVQRAQLAEATLRERTADTVSARAALAAAEKKTAVLETQLAQAKAALASREAAAEQARLNLSYTLITAPVDGTVGARSLRVGKYVQAGTALMAVVPLDDIYIVANFKETQLTHMRGGEPVDIHIDSFPDAVLKGHVDSLSPATGLEFALLPPDNATGNFTKIVQRVPVKIRLDAGSLKGLLRPGMSVIPTVDTKATADADVLLVGQRS